jgi:hypothetical protein
MFLFDVGENVADIKQKLNSIKNLTVISGEELDPSVTEICRTNPSKGYCESIGTSLFLKHYIEELKNYDFVIKITGRYFYIDIDKTFLTNENKDKYLCKNTRKFDWQDWWGYPELLKDNNQINWTPTQSYIIGNTQLNNFQESMLTVQSYYCDNPDVGKILDFECMFYHHILRNKTFVEIPWICGGWAGQTGAYSEY